MWRDSAGKGAFYKCVFKIISECPSSKVITFSITSEKQFPGRLRSLLSTAVPGELGHWVKWKARPARPCLAVSQAGLWALTPSALGTQKLAKWINEKHYGVVYLTKGIINITITWPIHLLDLWPHPLKQSWLAIIRMSQPNCYCYEPKQTNLKGCICC